MYASNSKCKLNLFWLKRKITRPLIQLIRLVEKELSSNSGVSLSRRVWAFSNGFLSDKVILYGLNKDNKNQYVSDFAENIRARCFNDADLIYVDNKLLFSRLIENDDAVTAPKELFLIKRGHIVSLENAGCLSATELWTKLKNESGRFILKPVGGYGGIGILDLDFRERPKRNGNLFDYVDFEVLINQLDDYYISEFMTQHSYAEGLYPETVNTIRLLTLIDPHNQEAYIAAAAHRIGNNQSYPVDNCGKGGFTANINLNSGELGAATRTITNGKKEWHIHHPDTGKPIAGVKIPEWDKLMQQVLKLANKFSFIPMLGWDIAVGMEGKLYIIEANEGPDHKLHQVHEGLLQNKQNRKFYEFYNIVEAEGRKVA